MNADRNISLPYYKSIASVTLCNPVGACHSHPEVGRNPRK
jgi:hypothetical protein